MNGIQAVFLRAWAVVRDERGAVSTEYALILTLVAMATILAIGAVGAAVAGLFDQAPPAFP